MSLKKRSKKPAVRLTDILKDIDEGSKGGNGIVIVGRTHAQEFMDELDRRNISYHTYDNLSQIHKKRRECYTVNLNKMNLVNDNGYRVGS
jgi:hypothetical protein